MVTKHLTQEDVNEVPTGDWYEYLLECGHKYYTKIRINVPNGYNEHFILCKKCPEGSYPTRWIPVVGMEAKTDAFVSNVLDGFSFIVPKRILRADGSRNGNIVPSGNPFPYTTKDRGY